MMRSRDTSGPTWSDLRMMDLEREQDDICDRVGRLENSVEGVKTQVKTLYEWGRRALLLALLSIAAVGSHLTVDDKAELVAKIMKSLK